MELLTGKAKEAFLKQFCGEIPINEICLCAHLIDFFDSVGIYINPKYNEVAKEFSYSISTEPITDDVYTKAIYKDRQEAKIAGIKKANEILNKKLKTSHL